MYPSTNNWVKAGTWDDDDIAHLRPFVCRDRPPPETMPSAHNGGGGGGDAGGGGGGGGGVVFFILFLLAAAGGFLVYARRQRQAGKPIVPEVVTAVINRRASPMSNVRPVQFDQERAPPMAYTPPLTVASLQGCAADAGSAPGSWPPPPGHAA